MEDSKTCEDDLIGNANRGFPQTNDEIVGFDHNSNEKYSQGLFDVSKRSMLKLVLDGVDKVFKDRRELKSHISLASGIALQECQSNFSTENGELGSPSLDPNRVHGQNAFEEKAIGVDTSSQENGSVCNKPGNTWLSLSKDYTNLPHMVTSRDYNQSPINYLTFIALLLMEIIGFQISLFISFFTFPIWLSYFCFMSSIFPLQT